MTDQPTDPPVDEVDEQSRLLSNSAVMAAGTTVSRLSGFLRAALLSYALGASVHADIFNVANSLPNMLYILLAGGIFNAVLVPQLVRSMRNDPDRGDAYTSRVDHGGRAVPRRGDGAAGRRGAADRRPRRTDVRRARSATRRSPSPGFCLPQVFFYGMFVLVGQILNARGVVRPDDVGPDRQQRDRGRGGARLHRRATARPRAPRSPGPFTSGQELLLGVGSTLGIAVQLLILVPYLRRSGFAYRPRLDLRGSGLGHTLRLGIWTVLFVIVNQIAYVVVQRLATERRDRVPPDGTGFTVYSFSFLVVMVPHSIVTVSLATAMLPRLSAHAAAGDRAGAGRRRSRARCGRRSP